MTGHYYAQTSLANDDDLDINHIYQQVTTPEHQEISGYSSLYAEPWSTPSSSNYTYHDTSLYNHPQDYQRSQFEYFQQPLQTPPLPQTRHSYEFPSMSQRAWSQPTVPSNYPLQQTNTVTFPRDAESFNLRDDSNAAGPSSTPAGYLSPPLRSQPRMSRATSFASNASSVRSVSRSDMSRSVSPNASEMAKWGFRNEDGSWSCAFHGCTSRSTFSRGCDLRKHYKRHTKSLFCRHKGCPQATEGGFSSKKDRDRHEAKHNPAVVCEEGCGRLFSRQDNMVSGICTLSVLLLEKLIPNYV